MSDQIGPDTLKRVDTYIEDLFVPEDAALTAALANMREHNLPAINVSANEGKLLYLLAKLSGARTVLEIGTLGGYSTIWLARALPAEGRVVTLEYESRHAEVARANFARAGLADQVEVRVGDAKQTMAEMAANGEGPFDLFFIDAEKSGYPVYLERALRLARPGSVILSDNLIRRAVIEAPPGDPDANTAGVIQFNQALAASPHLESIILPIIREQVDGLGISIVRSLPE